MLDIVYPYKRAARTWELRFSLRSLCNLPHQNVYIAGELPPWAKNVRHIPVLQEHHKWDNARANIVAACLDPRVSEDFILMNDDFFILRPIDRITEYHRGDLERFIDEFPHHSQYWKRVCDTNAILKGEGIEPRFMFDIHAPTVLNKKKVLEVCERFAGKNAMLRTLYHNIHGTYGEKREDPKKITGSRDLFNTDLLSTGDRLGRSPSFYMHMEQLFPRACYYERVST